MLNIVVKADALQLPSSLSGGNDPKLILHLCLHILRKCIGIKHAPEDCELC